MTGPIPRVFSTASSTSDSSLTTTAPGGQGGIRNKEELITSIDRRLTAFPGIIFNYTQPAEDAVDEALTGLKSSLAVKVYGTDLNVLEDKALQIKNALQRVPGFTELTVVRELGQPSLLIDVDREKIARYGVNVSDVEAVIQAAVGGQAATQVIQGEKLFDLVVRMQPQFRSSPGQIGNLLVGTPDGLQIPLKELSRHQGKQRRVIHLSRRQFALHRCPVQHRRPRSGARRARRPKGGRNAPCNCPKVIGWVGAANTASSSPPRSNLA